MNIESIIGITSGSIAIIGAIFGTIRYIRSKYKKTPTTLLFAQLTDKNLSDKERREILRKLNKSELFNNRIKADYIDNFSLNNRGKEAVLFDICDCNNIEPTDDACKGLINCAMPSLLEKYHKQRQINNEQISTTMNTNSMKASHKTSGNGKTDIVYMSKLLKEKFPETCEKLIQILDRHNVQYEFLKGTKDIWCRDYMPVQTKSGNFIKFKYEPSYLKGKKDWEESRTDENYVKEICKQIHIDVISSDINLDGGNVLICEDRAIISNRVFSENPNYDKESLEKELSELLECEIIIIKAVNSKDEDFTGHADGMVRFVNRDIILWNKVENEYKYIQDDMQKVCKQYGLKSIAVPAFVDNDKEHPDNAIGVYVNYLELNNLIVLPIFGREEHDSQAVSIIKEAFPNKIIETIDYNDVAREGGLLNCSTWNIKK